MTVAAPDFHGLPAGRTQSPFLTIDYLLGAGPRLVRFFAADSDENLLAELPGVGWQAPHGRYTIYGGHRLWVAPETPARTYIPDDQPPQVEAGEGWVTLTGPVEAPTGIRKSLTVRLAVDRPRATLTHCLANLGPDPVELAPWAITQLVPGGAALLPQPSGPADEAGLLPNRRLALWPYTRVQDERLGLDDALLRVSAPAQPHSPFKLGYFNLHGWLAYRRGDWLFVKRFRPQEGEPYPDYGCNVEVYTDGQVLELETLGPLRILPPGETVTHEEEWWLLRGFENAADAEVVEAVERLFLKSEK